MPLHRALGVIFLVLWGAGRLPAAFAWPAGAGDVLVGLTAPLVALAVARRPMQSRVGTDYASPSTGSGSITADGSRATVSFVSTPFPTVSASALQTDGDPALSELTLLYYISVNGPPDVLVPVVINGILSAVATNSMPTYASIELYLETSPGIPLYEDILQCYSLHCDSFVPLAINTTIYLPSDSDAIVRLYAQAGLYYAPAGTGSAYVDPIFSIDPTFLSMNPAYSIEVSPGIGNALNSSVPEPATWAMMLVGFGGLGGMMRMRRRQVATTA